MENNNILKSFELQKDLNPKIWKKSSKESYILSPKVREKLLEIAYEFIESLKVDVIVSDVHLTGSLANYNWSEYSDFDLHIIADFNQFSKNKLDLYKELFTLKKTIFNSDQNIKIYGYDVELYLQDENEEHTSSGVYSLISNDWLEKPKKEKFEVNKTILKKKIDQWTEKIDKVLESAEEEKDLQKSKKIIDNLKTKIKEYRKIGLEKGGEMSYENLVFKYLRRSGHIEKLFSFKKERLDKELSLKEQSEKEISTLSDFFKRLFGGSAKKEKIDDPKKADLIEPDVEEFYKNLESINEPIKQQQKGQRNFQKNVETVQIGLSLLGYELPRFGIDGLYGPETGAAVSKFKTDNSLKESKKNSKSLIRESSTYGFPEGGVDSGKVLKGGVDGDWGGSMERALEMLNFAKGCLGRSNIVSSQKRSRLKTASGRMSDHYVGNLEAYAVDIPTAGKSGDELLSCLMEKFNNGSHSNYKGGSVLNVTVDGYRYQFLWRVAGHYDHIHIGVKKTDGKTTTVPYDGGNTNTIDSGLGSTITPEMVKLMVEQLKSKSIKSEDLKKYLDVVNSGGGSDFIDLDLQSEEGYKNYKEICQKFINAQRSNLLGITGEMLADAARETYLNHRKYVPPQLALAQLAIEGGFSNNPDARPIKTKNPFNVGNVDDGSNVFHSSVESGIKKYYDLIATSYLTGGKTAADLVQNFVNKNGNRYASAKSYEQALQSLVSQINRTSVSPSLSNFSDLQKSESGSTKRKSSETNYSKLPENILSHISRLENKLGKKFTKKQIELEFEQEGGWRYDSGGVNKEAKKSIQKLVSDARKKFSSELSGVPDVVSGYRSYADQVNNFYSKVSSGRKISEVQSVTTIPGFSEHHTGKAFDIFSTDTDWWKKRPQIKNWVEDNAKNYGFKVSYTKKGVLRIAEPWHLYYVG